MWLCGCGKFLYSKWHLKLTVVTTNYYKFFYLFTIYDHNFMILSAVKMSSLYQFSREWSGKNYK